MIYLVTRKTSNKENNSLEEFMKNISQLTKKNREVNYMSFTTPKLQSNNCKVEFSYDLKERLYKATYISSTEQIDLLLEKSKDVAFKEVDSILKSNYNYLDKPNTETITNKKESISELIERTSEKEKETNKKIKEIKNFRCEIIKDFSKTLKNQKQILNELSTNINELDKQLTDLGLNDKDLDKKTKVSKQILNTLVKIDYEIVDNKILTTINSESCSYYDKYKEEVLIPLTVDIKSKKIEVTTNLSQEVNQSIYFQSLLEDYISNISKLQLISIKDNQDLLNLTKLLLTDSLNTPNWIPTDEQFKELKQSLQNLKNFKLQLEKEIEKELKSISEKIINFIN